MSNTTEYPKVFISYSWTSITHEDWVVSLAERLMKNGVEVILDKWELKERQDKFSFMERMVNDPSISKVLIICDKQYKQKADARKGGAGTESQIISSEIYGNVGQEKFVPVVREFEEEEPCVPTYLESRIYIDMSDGANFRESFDQLLRNIFDQPISKKPPLGPVPKHIFVEEPIRVLTTGLVSEFNEAYLKGAPGAKGGFKDYLQGLLEGIKEKEVVEDSNEIDDFVIQAIESFLPYRDEFIKILVLLESNSADFSYYEELFSWFEGVLSYLFSRAHVGHYKHDAQWFVVQELFVSLIAILIESRNLEVLELFLDEDYYFQGAYKRENKAFPVFNRFFRVN